MEYRLHHFHLVCRDLDRTISFFTDTLGGKFIEFRKFGNTDGAVIDLPGTPIYLRLAREEEFQTGGQPPAVYGYHHLGLKVEDLEACHSALTSRGFTFLTPPTATPRGKIAFFRGPDEIIIELVQEITQ